VIQNLGKFSRQDLAQIWHEDQYAQMHSELLRLMMNFKLCYEIPSSPHTYIAPQLLTVNQPDYNWDPSQNLLLRYTYQFMPKGILTRFIVEMHRWIEAETCVWRTGVVLSKDNARAEVIELYHNKEIQIRVCGNRKRDLLTTVRHEFDKIHKTYERLQYDTMVPCNCTTCKHSQTPHFYPLARLFQFQQDGKDIQCPISYEMVNVKTLVDDVNIRSKGQEDDRPPTPIIIKQDNRVFTGEVDMGDNIMGDNINVDAKGHVGAVGKNISGPVTVQGNVTNIESSSTIDPMMQRSIYDILKILQELHQTYPTTTEAQASQILDVELEELQTTNPKKWHLLRQSLLNPERWFNGGKAALTAALDHLANENLFAKAGVALLEGLSQEPDES
jgi:hypothetical protein